MRKYKYLLFLALLSVSFTGCNYFPYFDDDSSAQDGPIQHTLILYMMANNTLANYIDDDLREVVSAVDDKFSGKARIVIYYDRYEQRDNSDSTTLFLLKRNNISDDVYLERISVLKKYEDQIATEPETMQRVLNDVKELVPSKSYGIIISGHGTGWFPVPTKDPDTNTEINNQKVAPARLSGSIYDEHPFIKTEGAIETRWYGHDNVYRFNQTRNRYELTGEPTYMSSQEMALGLSPIKFDYIIFDACFMSSIEMLYDLRNNADYIIASPTEVLSDGFPYTNIIKGIFEGGLSLENAALLYMNHYQTNAATKSASITLIDCSQIDALAEKVKQIYLNGVNQVSVNNIQTLDGISQNHVFFDMNQYIEKLCTSDDLYRQYLEQFNRTVIYKNNTEHIYSAYGTIPVLGGKLELCGISAYIPRTWLPVTKSYYDNTAWAKFTQQ